MGFLDELKKLTKPYADEEEDYDDYDDEPVEEEEPPAPTSRATRRSATMTDPVYSRSSGLDTGRTTGSRIVNINTTTQLQVVLVKPERFDNVSEIADHLRDKHSVLLNLENTDRNIARRLVDFLSGCAYASSAASPTPWMARSRRWPPRPTCSPPTTWRLWAIW